MTQKNNQQGPNHQQITEQNAESKQRDKNDNKIKTLDANDRQETNKATALAQDA
jgi:hypothetical protein